MYKLPCLCLLSSVSMLSAATRTTVALDGPFWQLAGMEPGTGEALGVPNQLPSGRHFDPVFVPNDVQLTALKDPYGQGPEVARINQQEWWYVRSFTSPEYKPDRQVRLIFDGVDYFAGVWLNGHKLGEHEGAFTRFEFDVTDLLRPSGNNYLAVRVTAPWKVPGRSHFEFMKGEFAETWDALPGPSQRVYPLGLHRSVHLEVSDYTRVADLQVFTSALGVKQATLSLQVRIASATTSKAVQLRVSIQPENFAGETLDLPVHTATAAKREEWTVNVPEPHLWWTWDQGSQNLYRANARLYDANGQILDEYSTVFGIRTVERDENLNYKLNGRPVFLRGSWYSMATLYPAAADRWIYEKDLRLLRNANANHLLNYTTVERDEFYDLADQLGILLFMELPFNQTGPEDALDPRYPRRDDFMRWALVESGQIVRTLANHPSIAVWSAISETSNNGTDYATSSDPRIVAAADGYRMFVESMEKVIKANDPDSIYHKSYCDFGEQHFWSAGLALGGYDLHFDDSKGFISEYGGMGFFPFESIKRIISPATLWRKDTPTWSDMQMPVDPRKFSYLSGWAYDGMDLLASYIGAFVNRKPASFEAYINCSQLYQALLLDYPGDVYRRKLFAPIGGIRTWHFKDFVQKPISGFGLIDTFSTPKLAYYSAKRTWAPLSMSYAVRYTLESVPAGSMLKLPVWISNATNQALRLKIQTEVFDLNGSHLLDVNKSSAIDERHAAQVFEVEWKVPDRAGIYVVRGRAQADTGEIARAEMYIKVATPSSKKATRVLLVGTPEWTRPLADYLVSLGAEVTQANRSSQITTIQPKDNFPQSLEELRRAYDVIWLTGFNTYWLAAPEKWSNLISQAVEAGMPLVHSGGLASFHGGGGNAAALELTPIGKLLPVEVQAENDFWPKHLTKLPFPISSGKPDDAVTLRVTEQAPPWLKTEDFAGLAPQGQNVLALRSGAITLIESDGHPLLVTGRHGAARTVAYLGASPSGEDVVVDRAVRSDQGRLSFLMTAALLHLATGTEPAEPLMDLVESRERPLYEALMNTSTKALPEVSAAWTENKNVRTARVHIHNGSAFTYGFRLRLDGDSFTAGDAIALWDDQFFNLMPGEERDCKVEIRTRTGSPSGTFRMIGEAMNTQAIRRY